MIRSEDKIRRARIGAAALATLAATLLIGCGPKKDAPVAGDAADSEVVAKVNGDTLTAGQLAIVLQKQRGAHADTSSAAAKPVLDQLIDEQIVAQRALAAKLDQDPKVVAQLEAARRDILARRFIEQSLESAAKPTDEAVQKFYDSRPLLLAQRKVFSLQRTEIQAPAERRADIEAKARSAKSLAELTDWLKAQKLPFSTRAEQSASDQLPPVVLEKLSTLKPGESTVAPSQFGIPVLTLVSSTAAPKSLADARPAIEQFLSNQGRREMLLGLQKSLRDGAKIEYEGRFAASQAADAASAVPASAPVAPASVAGSAPAVAASQGPAAQK